MEKRILYCASTASHIINFHLPYIQFFHEIGWKIDIAVEREMEIPYADKVFALPFEKNILAASNLCAVSHVKNLLTKNEYDIISAHTTLAGAVVRIATQMLGKSRPKVVYTSHGYFFNGEGGLSDWPFLWVEMLLAPVTDVLMVMNKVDYRLAERHKLGKQIVSIPGMGIDTSRVSKPKSEDKKRLKVAAGFEQDDVLVVYAAELSKRKNQIELIRAFSRASNQEPSLKLLLAGEGGLRDEYMKVAEKCGHSENIHFLGHVSDMPSLYSMCDFVATTSISEGLPFNVMEAMASGLPVVASKTKGHTDLLEGLQKRFLYRLGDEQALTDMLLSLCHDDVLRNKLGDENKIKVKKYQLEFARLAIIAGYRELLELSRDSI